MASFAQGIGFLSAVLAGASVVYWSSQTSWTYLAWLVPAVGSGLALMCLGKIVEVLEEIRDQPRRRSGPSGPRPSGRPQPRGASPAGTAADPEEDEAFDYLTGD